MPGRIVRPLSALETCMCIYQKCCTGEMSTRRQQGAAIKPAVQPLIAIAFSWNHNVQARIPACLHIYSNLPLPFRYVAIAKMRDRHDATNLCGSYKTCAAHANCTFYPAGSTMFSSGARKGHLALFGVMCETGQSFWTTARDGMRMREHVHPSDPYNPRSSSILLAYSGTCAHVPDIAIALLRRS